MIARSDGRSAGLINATMPQHDPRSIHVDLVGVRRQRIASAIIPIREHAEMLVSQKMAGIHQSGSDTAQKAPATVAARESSISRATYMISQIVNSPRRICIPRITSTEACV